MLTAVNLISTILSIISILVAAIVIFVIIYVNAINKRRQIGILKAIGIKQKLLSMPTLSKPFFTHYAVRALVCC